MSQIGTSERLIIRRLDLNDAAFIFQLLNQESWLKFIGDKQIYNLAAATKYLMDGPLSMYQQHGFGLFAVERKADGLTIGLCGLIKRAELVDVDIGFAFLDEFSGCGYAYEAALLIKDYAINNLKLKRLVAIVNPDNQRSIKLLEKIGLHFEALICLSQDKPCLNLMALNFEI